MSDKTGISWTEATWNPLRGCTIVSPGCTNCYAMKMAARFSGPGQAYEGLAEVKNGHAVWTGKVAFVEKHIDDPIRWKRSRRIFVNSMSDVFHETVPDAWIDRIFDVMETATQHQYQVLTKRPERMKRYIRERCVNQWVERDTDGVYATEEWAQRNPHIWIGISVEDQKRADERIPLLLDTPAAVRWLSMEPLIGPVDLSSWLWNTREVQYISEIKPKDRLHWVVTGGESGVRRREMDPQWVRDIRDQCVDARVAFYHKQDSGVRSGERPYIDGFAWHQYPGDLSAPVRVND